MNQAENYILEILKERLDNVSGIVKLRSEADKIAIEISTLSSLSLVGHNIVGTVERYKEILAQIDVSLDIVITRDSDDYPNRITIFIPKKVTRA